MTHLGLFEGIGGFSLAARWMGWETLAWCECNEFGQKVLRHHFPEAEGFGDITKTDFTKYANRIDILTGGFPCQPYSHAGKRKGKDDERHLWPEMLRAIREIQPRYVVGENVSGLISWNGGLVFEEVQIDLESEGYEVQPFVLPAAGVDAPHRRDRVWFVAFNANNTGDGITKNTNDNGRRCEFRQKESCKRQQRNVGSGNNERIQADNGEVGIITDTDNARTGNDLRINGKRQTENNGWNFGFAINNEQPFWQKFPTQSPVCGRNDGLPKRLDGITFPKWRNESIKAYGNAIVPQVALQIFKAIEQTEKELSK